MAAKSEGMWERVKQASASFWNAGKEKVATAVAKPRARASSLLRKYVPALMIFSGGLTASAAQTQNLKDNVKVPNPKEIKVDNKNIQIGDDGLYHFKNLHIDTNNLKPEMLNMRYMTNNQFDAVYAPKGKAATIENATGFGPYLTRMEDLKKFITKYRDKYKMLYEIMNTKGLNNKAFVNAWNQCNHDEIIKDLDIEKWNNEYQPLFDKLSQKLGYSKVTYQTRGNADNFGYVAAVMSCHGQSSKTFDIFKKAKSRAEKKFGKKVTLDDIVDESYDVRHELYGLKKRYYGNTNMVGEKEANQIMRGIVRQMKSTYTGFKEYLQSQGSMMSNIVHNQDAIMDYTMDTVYWDRQEADRMAEIHVAEEPEIKDKKTQSGNPYMSMPILEVEEQYGVLQREMRECQQKIDEISSGKYPIMGRKIKVNYATFTAPEASYLYESACDPTMKDKANSAIGLPQYNLNNTAKSLVRYLAKEYPELYNAMNTYGIKSRQFAAVWNKYSTASNHKKFEARQFDFMWEKFYNSWFDTLHKRLNMPVITKQMVTDNDRKYWVYIASVISVGHQRPASVVSFAEGALNRVVAKTGISDPNAVGLEMYNVRDEVWAKRYNKATGKWTIKNRAMHHRFKGGAGITGEQELCENVMRYDRESPQLFAHMQEITRTMKNIELALAERSDERVMLADQQKRGTFSTDKKSREVAQTENKTQKVRNMRELYRARQRAQRNSTVAYEQHNASRDGVKRTSSLRKTASGNTRRA